MKNHNKEGNYSRCFRANVHPRCYLRSIRGSQEILGSCVSVNYCVSNLIWIHVIFLLEVCVEEEDGCLGCQASTDDDLVKVRRWERRYPHR